MFRNVSKLDSGNFSSMINGALGLLYDVENSYKPRGDDINLFVKDLLSKICDPYSDYIDELSYVVDWDATSDRGFERLLDYFYSLVDSKDSSVISLLKQIESNLNQFLDKKADEMFDGDGVKLVQFIKTFSKYSLLKKIFNQLKSVGIKVSYKF